MSEPTQDPVNSSDGPAEMQPYQALYRRFRPQRFSEVRGQEHVTRALINAVRDNKVAHAYLFSGPRGTGKTSTARILAMALNCEHPVEGEPDTTCESCREIRSGSSIDVQELDAASNRRLEEMRDLLSRVALGTRSRWKVYIIDEVHQLTSDAASALLKTLEEPPPHVVFVLATTDPQKVLPTIRSRTQHFEFRLLGAEVLSGLLNDLNQEAGLGLAPGAIDAVLRRGHGSARDALSALDQVAAAGSEEDETDLIGDLVEAVASAEAGRALVTVGEAAASGRDPRRLAVDLLEHLRNAFLSIQAKNLVMLSDDMVQTLEGQARRIGLRRLVQAMDTIGQASTDMRDSVEPRVTLEVALVKICGAGETAGAATTTGDTGELHRQIAALEARLAALEAGPRGTQSGTQGRTSNETQERNSPPSGGARSSGPAPEARTAPARPLRPPRPGSPTATPSGASPPRTSSATRPAPPRRPGAGQDRQGPSSEHPAGGDRPRPADSGSSDSVSPPPSGQPTRVAHSSIPALPSRDEVTKAWGDSILSDLPGSVRAYTASARCVEVSDEAVVMGVPDQGLLSRAQGKLDELQEAFARHFGRPVPIRLVVDNSGATGLPGDSQGRHLRSVPDIVEEEIASIDPSELEVADGGVASPEQAIFDAFPGAKEVDNDQS